MENQDAKGRVDLVECREVHPGVTVTREILRGGVSEGVEMTTLSNGEIAVYVLETRGMGIWKVEVQQNGQTVRVGWDSPVKRPVNPRNVPLNAPDGCGWLFGFNEFVARCGLQWNGGAEFDEKTGNLRYSLHGLVQNTPAYPVTLEVDEEAQEVRLTGVVREGRLFFNTLELTSTVVLPFHGKAFRLEDKVRNVSARDAEMELLYHINTGVPIASPGARMYVPYCRVMPRDDFAASQLGEIFDYHEPKAGEPEACFFYDLAAEADGSTGTFLRNPAGDFGVALAFNKTEFPHFCQWKCQHAFQDGYVTGMEPATSFPNQHSFEKANGRVITLAPNAERQFHIGISFSTTPEDVAASIARIEALQAKCPNPVMDEKIDPTWGN